MAADILVEALLHRVTRWARATPDIVAVALVGSHARQQARADSDVDVMLLTTTPQRYVDDVAWATTFGGFSRTDVEHWGNVTSVRVHYDSGLEVEFGITTPAWAASPVDPGTLGVVCNGIVVLLDRDGTLSKLAASVGHAKRARGGSAIG